MYNLIRDLILESWRVLGEMSPYLLFGFLAAGVLSVIFSPEWIERHLGSRGFRPVFKAAMLGVPLPLCSCGVIPVAASMRRHGASRAATISFLLSTPQTGAENISVMWALLGPVFAIFSPFAALITGLLGGGLVHFFGEKDPHDDAGQPVKVNACNRSCCLETEKNKSFLVRALRFGFLTLPRDIGLSLLVGVLIAGAIGALVPTNQLKPYFGNELVSILMMMALGIPLYVCATASVPIAAGLIHMGVSPGAALAFLISGPATNAATVSTTWRLLGRRTSLLYLLTIALSAVLCGLTLNWLMSVVPIHMPKLVSHTHDHMQETGWLPDFWAIILLLVIGLSYLWPTREAAESHEHNHEHEPENGENTSMLDSDGNSAQRLELAITGMTCSHCAAAVSGAIKECEGVRNVEVNLKEGRAVIAGDNLDRQKLIHAVESLGYEART